MRHLDDGLIAEHLDGQTQAPAAAQVAEHLGACVACRERVEEARQERTRARSLLEAAAPSGLAPPPFETVLERAGRARRRRARLPLHGLGLAASLVLALGVGWLARDLTLAGLPREPRAPEPAAVQVQGAADQEAAAHAPEAAEVRRLAMRSEEAPALRAAPPSPGVADVPPLEDLGPSHIAPSRASPEPAPLPAPDTPWRTVSREEAQRALGAPIFTVEGLAVWGHRLAYVGGVPRVATTQALDEFEVLHLEQHPAAPPGAREDPEKERAVAASPSRPRQELAARGFAAREAAPSELGPLAPDAPALHPGELRLERTGQVVILRAPLEQGQLEALAERLGGAP
jgi:hypothetical protein